jgi:XTP/dITP diphosphohydrolase
VPVRPSAMTGRAASWSQQRPLRAELASRNEHKLNELKRALPDWDLTLLEAAAFPPEEGTTYYDNARAKARFGRAISDPHVWVLGEDSGLEVKGLAGGPGVTSSRFAPDGDFVGRLLAELQGVEGEPRRARYVCELVCLSPELEEFRGTGTLQGRIASEPRGSEGFGYDPIFIPDGESETVAQLGNVWKSERSHRSRAAQALRDALGQARPAASS